MFTKENWSWMKDLWCSSCLVSMQKTKLERAKCIESSADTWRALKWEKESGEIEVVGGRVGGYKDDSFAFSTSSSTYLHLFYNPMHVRCLMPVCPRLFVVGRSPASSFSLQSNHPFIYMHVRISWKCVGLSSPLSLQLLINCHITLAVILKWRILCNCRREISGDTSTFPMQMLCMRSDYSMFNLNEWKILQIISSASLCTFADIRETLSYVNETFVVRLSHFHFWDQLKSIFWHAMRDVDFVIRAITW